MVDVMVDYYQYMSLKNISEKFRIEFYQLVKNFTEEYGKEKIKRSTLTFNMNGSYDEPEITFDVSDLDFNTRHKIDDELRELLNKHNISFSFGSAG